MKRIKSFNETGPVIFFIFLLSKTYYFSITENRMKNNRLSEIRKPTYVIFLRSNDRFPQSSLNLNLLSRKPQKQFPSLHSSSIFVIYDHLLFPMYANKHRARHYVKKNHINSNNYENPTVKPTDQDPAHN